MVSRMVESRVKQNLRSTLRKVSDNRRLVDAMDVKAVTRWIERQWEPWMSWDNYGLRSWQWQIHQVVPGAHPVCLSHWNFAPTGTETTTALDVLALVCCVSQPLS